MPLMPAVLGPNTRLNNFRLNYLTADQAAERPAHVWVVLGGIDITRPGSATRVIYKSMSISDRVYDEPNTCALVLYGAAPTVGTPIEVWLNSNVPQLLFNGELQTVERTYKGQPSTVLHPVTAIDDTARANRRRPLMPFVNVSATTVAATIMQVFAPEFSTMGIDPGLPPVTITFDGSEGGMKGCLTALAKLIGAYWYFEQKTLFFFITPPGPSPDPIDETPGRFLHDPAITWAIDKSQVRTRVYGKGASTQIATTIAAATDLVPVVEATMFNPAGGKAIAGLSPEAAASRILTYAGVQLGGGGGLVGPGAAPSAVPGLVQLDGYAGIPTGAHRYAFTFVTASGESLPGPVATISVGPLAAPATALVANAATAGGAVPPGTYRYTVTFVTAIGETSGAPASLPVTTTVTTPVTPPPLPSITWATGYFPHLPPGTYYYAYGYQTASGATLPGPNGPLTVIDDTTGWAPYQYSSGFRSTDPRVTLINIYRGTSPSTLKLLTQISNVGNVLFIDANQYTPGANAPTVDTAAGPHLQTVPLSQIPIGPANVTARKIYREGGGWWYLVGTLANNTATTFTDTAASTGASMPGASTAAANQVQVTVPVGASAVTARRVYRSAANVTPLQLLYTIPDNTTPSFTDAVGDGSLGAAPPVTDTSGLTQPNGQVPAGSTSIIVANPEPFAAGGGWAVVGNGEQVIRYTGKSASALTGIPATGPGALVASVSYNSTITGAPALVGVTGVIEQILRGGPVHVWVQRDDLAAQAAMAAMDGSGDGVYEHIWSDERRSETSLNQVCDAQLKLYSRPLVTVSYASRDPKTKSGKTVTIALTSPAINESLTIQDVTITELGIRGLVPKFTVTASTARQSFEAILQMLIRKADA